MNVLMSIKYFSVVKFTEYGVVSSSVTYITPLSDFVYLSIIVETSGV